MNIVIVGGGVVGSSLAQQLLAESHTISLIETNPELSETIASKIDLQVVTGSGSSPEALEAAGIQKADMVLAVTPIDEVNLLVCNFARQYDVPRRIARLRSREFVSADRHISLEDVGVTEFIYPEKVVVDSILQYIETPGAVDAMNFENGKILMRGYRVTPGMKIIDKPLSELRGSIEPEIFLVAAVLRNGKGLIPAGDFVVQEGDTVFCLFPRSSLSSVMKLIRGTDEKTERVVVSGDNLSTEELIATVKELVQSVILIDPDLKHAERVAGAMSKVEVIYGDATDPETIVDLDLDRADFFIASSSQADHNMLASLLAKAEGAREVAAVSTEFQHDKLFQSIGIDHVINPRMTAANQIMQLISRGHFGSVVKIRDADIQAVRLTISPNSDVSGVPLKKVWRKIQGKAIIGIIIRENEMIIPGGDTALEPDDHVIIIAYSRSVAGINKLFKAR